MFCCWAWAAACSWANCACLCCSAWTAACLACSWAIACCLCCSAILAVSACAASFALIVESTLANRFDNDWFPPGIAWIAERAEL